MFVHHCREMRTCQYSRTSRIHGSSTIILQLNFTQNTQGRPSENALLNNLLFMYLFYVFFHTLVTWSRLLIPIAPFQEWLKYFIFEDRSASEVSHMSILNWFFSHQSQTEETLGPWGRGQKRWLCRRKTQLDQRKRNWSIDHHTPLSILVSIFHNAPVGGRNAAVSIWFCIWMK